MAIYRVQVVHASYWRGEAHRWQSTYHYIAASGSVDFAGIVANMLTILRGLGASNYPGGVAEIKVYPSTGGVPVYSQTYFNWDTPAAWVPYTGTEWGTSTAALPTSGEAAAILTVPVGLSKSGKPVTLRTYWHAFAGANPEVAGAAFLPAVLTAVSTQATKLLSIPGTSGPAFIMCTPSGGPVGTQYTLASYVGNHQRTRGRRRKITTIQGPSGQSIGLDPGDVLEIVGG